MEQTRSADGTVIAFEKLGRGPSLILVGGAFSDHRFRAAGLPLGRALADSFTVFCYDRRGRGGSGDTAAYAIAREVEDLAALLEVAGGSAKLYGHSSGALLALEAARAGLSISRLALYEPPLVLTDHRPAIPADLVDRLVALTAAGNRSECVTLFLTRAVGVPEAVLSQRRATPAWAELELTAHTLSYDARLAADPAALLTHARALDVPTLVLDGGRSPAWLRFAAKALAEAIPGAAHVSIPEQPHDIDPAALAPSLLSFFQLR